MKVSFQGSDELKDSGASYIKVYLELDEGNKFEDHFECDLESKDCLFTITKGNPVNVLKTIREKEISFSLKKKKFLYKTNLDT